MIKSKFIITLSLSLGILFGAEKYSCNSNSIQTTCIYNTPNNNTFFNNSNNLTYVNPSTSLTINDFKIEENGFSHIMSESFSIAFNNAENGPAASSNVNFKISGNGTGALLKNLGSGVIVGKDGKGTISLNFNGDNSSGILALGKTDGKSLIGNLVIRNYGSGNENMYFKSYMFGDIDGNIKVSKTNKTNNNNTNLKTKFIFNDLDSETNIKGDITVNTGTNVFVFNSANTNVYGNINAELNTNGKIYIESDNNLSTISLYGKDNRITGLGSNINLYKKENKSFIIDLYNNEFKNNKLTLGLGQTTAAGENGLYGSGHTFVMSEEDHVTINKISDNNSINYIDLKLDKNKNYSSKKNENKTLMLLSSGQNVNDNTIKKVKNSAQIVGFDILDYNISSRNGNTPNVDAGSKVFYLSSIHSLDISEEAKQTSVDLLTNDFKLFYSTLNSYGTNDIDILRKNSNKINADVQLMTGSNKFNFLNKYNYNDDGIIYTTLKLKTDVNIFNNDYSKLYSGLFFNYSNGILYKQNKYTDKNLDLNGVEYSNMNKFDFGISLNYIQNESIIDNNHKYGFYSNLSFKFSSIISDSQLYRHNNNYVSNMFGLSLENILGYKIYTDSNKIFYLDLNNTFSFGYLSNNNITQYMSENYLNSKINSINIIKNKIGSNFGLNLTNITNKLNNIEENKNEEALLYFGVYYLSDYFMGGDITLLSNMNKLSNLNLIDNTFSDNMIIEFGTNFKINSNNSVNFNFEKSFFGKIVNDYNLSFGYKYSF